MCCMHMAAETCVDKWQRAYVWHAGWSHDNRLLFAVTGSGCDSRGADTAREYVALHARNNQRDCAVLDVSLGGLSFVAEGELLPGMSVQIDVHEQESLGTLELILLRVQSLSGHSLCGGKFLGLSDTQNESLQRLLEELAKNAKSSILSGD